MTKRIWFEWFALFAIQIALTLSPFLPWLSGVVASLAGQSDPATIVISTVGMHATLIAASLLLAFREVREAIGEQTRKLDKTIDNVTEISAIRDDMFYKEFSLAVERAQNEVLITYLASVPPAEYHKERLAYYTKLKRTIKDRPNVRYRRIVRDCRANRPWISEFIKSLQGRPNADFAIFKDSDDDKMPRAISIQIVDGTEAWLVAIEAHERTGSSRDLYVRNKVFAQMMAKYHQRLWEKSEMLVEAGQITNAGKAILSQQEIPN